MAHRHKVHHEHHKHGGRAHHKKHHASGGRVGDKLDYADHASQVEKGGAHGDVYTGDNSPTVKEARSEHDGFKKGGHVHGKKGKHHMGHHGKHHGKHKKYARGGRTGGSPFSHAHVKTNGDAAGGHKG